METRPQPNCTLTPLGTHTGEGHPNAFETVRSTASTQLCSLDDRPHRRTPAKEKQGETGEKLGPSNARKKVNRLAPLSHTGEGKNRGEVGENLGHTNAR